METTVTQRLISLRNHFKLEQEDLAKAIGVTQSAISQIEIKGKISYKSAKKISDTYKINIDWLIHGIPEDMFAESGAKNDTELTKENEELKSELLDLHRKYISLLNKYEKLEAEFNRLSKK